jgi:hypothetical protein
MVLMINGNSFGRIFRRSRELGCICELFSIDFNLQPAQRGGKGGHYRPL